METSEPNNPTAELKPREPLAPLPFAYQRTHNPDEAQYSEWRVSPVTIGGKKNEPYTDEEIIKMVKRDRESKDWFITEHWRNKGMPVEQIEFGINGRQVTVYNYNQEKPFTDEHIERASKVFQEFAARFPQILDQLRWVLIDDHQLPSAFGDPEKYPTNGLAHKSWRAFQLYPRGMELIPHRVAAATNFDGTLTHELTHLIQGEFEDEWGEKFKWGYCFDDENQDEWEPRLTPDGSMKRPFNKKTGEMSPQGQFSMQPDQCVTFYAKQNMGEDIAESMVAYVYDPELLKTISPDKYDILEKHDANQPHQDVRVQRIPKDQIALPEVKPETVLYYVKEEPDTRVFNITSRSE